jgi:transposase
LLHTTTAATTVDISISTFSYFVMVNGRICASSQVKAVLSVTAHGLTFRAQPGMLFARHHGFNAQSFFPLPEAWVVVNH